MTPRRATPVQVVRVNTTAESTRALDALWREGGPVIEAPSVVVLRAWLRSWRRP